MQELPGYRVCLVTAPSVDAASAIARAVVEEGLCACVNIVPGVTSVYRWEGKLQTGAEVLMVLKTTAAAVEALRARVVALHPYSVPEFLALGVEAGHEPYLAWVAAGVQLPQALSISR